MPGCVIEVSLIQRSCAVVQRLLRISWHWCAASFHLPLTWINPVSPPDRSSMSSPEICVAPCRFSSSSSLSFKLLYHHFFALLLALCRSFPILDLQPFFIHSVSSFQLFFLSTGIKQKLLEGDCVWLHQHVTGSFLQHSEQPAIKCCVKHQQMEQGTRRCEAKCTFNNKGGVVSPVHHSGCII